jgi:DNA-binding response OmpR family regulator
MAHLLIVEDDELLRDGLRDQLTQAGFRSTTAEDGEQALALLGAQAFDGVVLDLGLPRVDGLTVLRRLRQQLPALPVLILTARDGIEDRVAGLNAGADDYLTKPFNRDELLARLQAMLRRARLPAFDPGTPAAGSPHAGGLRLDPAQPRAWMGSEAIDLTQREWELLGLLLRHSGQVVSREAVLAAWQADGESSGLASNALEVYVHRLRRKLAGAPLTIRNIRGLGYMLEV